MPGGALHLPLLVRCTGATLSEDYHVQEAVEVQVSAVSLGWRGSTWGNLALGIEHRLSCQVGLSLNWKCS